MQLNERMIRLINLLLQTDGIKSGVFLAEFLGVSSRTIRNDIKYINDFSKEIGIEINSVVGRGYSLNIVDNKKIKKIIETSNKTQSHIDERLNLELSLIIKNTLKISNLTFNQIIDKLNISDATLNKDIILLKASLKNTNISIIKNKSNILVLDGNENDLRGEITQILYTNSDFFNLENDKYITGIFEKNKIENIIKSLNKFIKEVNYQLSDELFSLLVLHVAIGLYRPCVNLKPFDDKRSLQVYDMVRKSLGVIDSIYNSNLEIDSWFYTRMVLSMNNMFHQNVDNTLYSNLESKIVEILGSIQKETGIKFLLDSILINGLVLHLNSLFERQKFNMRFHNQTLDVIKLHYPMAYEVAIFFSKEISNIYDIKVDENEIGLIAIHFGGSLERLELHTIITKNVVIVCGYGIAMAMLVKERLKNEFGNQIMVKAILNSNELLEYDLSNIDYVFTTIPIDIKDRHKVINVDIALSETDIKSIERQLNYNDAYESLLSLFSKEHFYKNILVSTSDEAINWLGSQMVESGAIDKPNVEEVIKRELISSTEVGNLVAIPHCFNTYSNKSSIGIMTLEKPIIWKKEKVQIIFLIVLAADKKPIWGNVFRLLYPFITSDERVKKIINEYDFEQLLKAISSVNKED